jgi:hypothetical protein
MTAFAPYSKASTPKPATTFARPGPRRGRPRCDRLTTDALSARRWMTRRAYVGRAACSNRRSSSDLKVLRTAHQARPEAEGPTRARKSIASDQKESTPSRPSPELADNLANSVFAGTT